MDLMKFVAKHITIPLYELKEGRNLLPIIRGLDKSQYYTFEEIRKVQFEKIRDIIQYAYEHTSFYKRRFDENGIKTQDIHSFDDFRKIPALNKDDIRNHRNQMLSDEFVLKDLIMKRTGGSTSVPLKLYIDKKACDFKLAATIRHNLWANYERCDKLAAIWGDTDKRYSFREKLYNYLIGRVIYLDTLKIDREYVISFVKNIRKFRPEILMGHAHSLYVFACMIEENNVKDLHFKGIISTAEILYDNEREKIESVFGKTLFNRYGCEELSIIASECDKHDGLHITAEGLYVEVIDGDEINPGKLVITDLWNRGMPLIRYEIGDMATIKTGICACGRGLPRLGKIYGRTTDFLYTPEGKMISGISILDTFTIHIPGIKQVQIIQDRIDELQFKIVKADDFNENSVKILAEKIPDYFGPKMKLQTDFVDKIPLTQRGKYRFTICNIKNNVG